jgi:GntR family histidine utilization transcriptional repressor
MNSPSFRNWQSVQDEVLRRIHAREWKPGDLIPNEADLAQEFGCARTTVNRALRALAENGLLDRRRKAGTRVAAQPVAKATLDIAVIRREVEERGQKYG